MSAASPSTPADKPLPPLPHFCPHCGQESRIRAPRLGEFLQQFGGAYFSTEGALWRTLALLLFRPGDMDLRPGEWTIFELGDGRGAGMRDGKFFCTSLPAWACKRLGQRLDVDPKGLQREAEQMGQRFLSNMGAAMFLMVPLFALWQKLLYWNRRLHYTEHLVYALHLHAFWFVALMLCLPDLPWLTGLAALSVPVYAWWASTRVYGGRWWPRLLRATLVSLLYLLALGMMVGLVILWSLVF